MARIFLPALLIFCFSSGSGLAAAPDAATQEAAVRAAENDWSKAFITGDVAVLDALLDPAYVSVGVQGGARTKAEIIALARKFASEHPGTKAMPLSSTSKIDIKGASAIVVHHNATDTSVDVFYFSDGRWRAWYSQHTAIVAASPVK